MAEPYLELHPADARRLGLQPASLAEVASPHGRAILRVLITDRVAEGHPFAPIHWTGETAPSGRVDVLVPGLVDPVSGQPASKSAPVSVEPFRAAWYGYAIAAREFRPDCDYWARATLPDGVQVELAGAALPEDWAAYGAAMFGLEVEPIVMRDRKRGLTRLAFIQDGRLVAALFVGPDPVAVARAHVAGLLGAPVDPGVLAGQPGADRPDQGATVCACFGVGVNTIARAIAEQGLVTVEGIGAALRAGTNCGSCRPEIGALIRLHMPRCEAAE
jgi:assimilatory nitrate reductase catalytic subunit